MCERDWLNCSDAAVLADLVDVLESYLDYSPQYFSTNTGGKVLSQKRDLETLLLFRRGMGVLCKTENIWARRKWSCQYRLGLLNPNLTVSYKQIIKKKKKRSFTEASFFYFFIF